MAQPPAGPDPAQRVAAAQLLPRPSPCSRASTATGFAVAVENLVTARLVALPARCLARPAFRSACRRSVRAVMVDAEHVPRRIPERTRLHVVVHGHRAVDPGAAERLSHGQGLLDVGDV